MISTSCGQTCAISLSEANGNKMIYAFYNLRLFWWSIRNWLCHLSFTALGDTVFKKMARCISHPAQTCEVKATSVSFIPNDRYFEKRWAVRMQKHGAWARASMQNKPTVLSYSWTLLGLSVKREWARLLGYNRNLSSSLGTKTWRYVHKLTKASIRLKSSAHRFIKQEIL